MTKNMTSIVEMALHRLVTDAHFGKLAEVAATMGKGVEAGVYAYLNRFLFELVQEDSVLRNKLVGLGPLLMDATHTARTRHRITFDFGMQVESEGRCDVYGIELKGPTSDMRYLAKQMECDAGRLARKLSEKKICGGTCVGIFAGKDDELAKAKWPEKAKELYRHKRDAVTIVIAAHHVDEHEDDQVAKAGLAIVKAEYGVRGQQTVDITAAVAECVNAGSLDIVAGNHIGGDPLIGTAKYLYIDYRRGDALLSCVVPEGCAFHLEEMVNKSPATAAEVDDGVHTAAMWRPFFDQIVERVKKKYPSTKHFAFRMSQGYDAEFVKQHDELLECTHSLEDDAETDVRKAIHWVDIHLRQEIRVATGQFRFPLVAKDRPYGAWPDTEEPEWYEHLEASMGKEKTMQRRQNLLESCGWPPLEIEGDDRLDWKPKRCDFIMWWNNTRYFRYDKFSRDSFNHRADGTAWVPGSNWNEWRMRIYLGWDGLEWKVTGVDERNCFKWVKGVAEWKWRRYEYYGENMVGICAKYLGLSPDGQGECAAALNVHGVTMKPVNEVGSPKREAASPAVGGECFVVDGSNLVQKHRDVGDRPSCGLLLTVLQSILAHGGRFTCIFDANICHVLRQNGQSAEVSALQQLAKEFPTEFTIVTGRSRADFPVLHAAEAFNWRIISNDTYSKPEDGYVEQFPFLRDAHTTRLIQVNAQRSGLVSIEKLAWRLKIGGDVDGLFRELQECLTKRRLEGQGSRQSPT